MELFPPSPSFGGQAREKVNGEAEEGDKKKDSDAIRREKFLKTTEGRRLLNQQCRDIIKK